MKNAICSLFFALAAAATTSAIAADAGSCYAIQSADARAYCLAKAHGNPSGCYSIQSSDKRSECLAELRN